MNLPSLKRLKNLEGKRVMVRVDFNVPIERGRVVDDTRIRASLPTIEYLLEKKAKVILVAHLGRPEGRPVNELQVDPIARKLSKLLDKKVQKLPDWRGTLVDMAMRRMKPGSIIMLENIRFSPDEESNTGTLAKDLASLCDIFVLDGFAVAHRASASVSGVAKYVKAYAGLLLEQEIKGLDTVTKKPKSPFVVVLGGVKTETKLPVMKQLLPKVDHILIGGAIVNTYLKARGYDIGDSLYDADVLSAAYTYCRRKKVITPLDVIVGKKDGSEYRVVEIEKNPHTICKKGEAMLDIGPKTVHLYATYIKSAKTVVWNGAMGYFEQKPYDKATRSIARLVASVSKGTAYGIIGGGETIQAMEMVKMEEYVDLVSTGGGAMLEYLSGKKLPGLEVLRKM